MFRGRDTVKREGAIYKLERSLGQIGPTAPAGTSRVDTGFGMSGLQNWETIRPCCLGYFVIAALPGCVSPLGHPPTRSFHFALINISFEKHGSIGLK